MLEKNAADFIPEIMTEVMHQFNSSLDSAIKSVLREHGVKTDECRMAVKPGPKIELMYGDVVLLSWMTPIIREKTPGTWVYELAVTPNPEAQAQLRAQEEVPT